MCNNQIDRALCFVQKHPLQGAATRERGEKKTRHNTEHTCDECVCGSTKVWSMEHPKRNNLLRRVSDSDGLTGGDRNAVIELEYERWHRSRTRAALRRFFTARTEKLFPALVFFFSVSASSYLLISVCAKRGRQTNCVRLVPTSSLYVRW